MLTVGNDSADVPGEGLRKLDILVFVVFNKKREDKFR